MTSTAAGVIAFTLLEPLIRRYAHGIAVSHRVQIALWPELRAYELPGRLLVLAAGGDAQRDNRFRYAQLSAEKRQGGYVCAVVELEGEKIAGVAEHGKGKRLSAIGDIGLPAGQLVLALRKFCGKGEQLTKAFTCEIGLAVLIVYKFAEFERVF